MTPLVLLVGFLGSGKTTFLKNLLPQLSERGVQPHVIINDYRNARVDAEQLRGLASEIAAISGDCVCCGSKEELVTALENFEHAPRRLVLVETNGTTDSEQLIEMLSLDPVLRKFSLPIQLSVIDAQRWQKRFWHNGLEREQARTASHLFLSRADTVPAPRLSEVEQSLAKHHVAGLRVTAAAFAEELSVLCDELSALGDRHLSRPCSCGGHHHHEGHVHGDHEHHDHDHSHSHAEHHFSSMELPLPDQVSRQNFATLLRELPQEVIRAKGLVRFQDTPKDFFVFQKVDHSDEPQFFPVGDSPRVTTPLALFIGPNLPEEKLTAAVAALSKID